MKVKCPTCNCYVDLMFKSLEDCIGELKRAGIDFRTIVRDQERLKERLKEINIEKKKRRKKNE